MRQGVGFTQQGGSSGRLEETSIREGNQEMWVQLSREGLNTNAMLLEIVH